MRDYRLLYVGVCFAIAYAVPAQSKTCGDYTDGAISINEATDDDLYSPQFIEKYEGFCVVKWLGSTRGQAGRDTDKLKCSGITGASMAEFFPDRGSNYNVCVFRPDSPLDGRAAPHRDGEKQQAPKAVPTYPAPQNDQASRYSKTQNASYEVKICNNSPDNLISIAVAKYESPDDERLTVSGWRNIKYADCTSTYGNLGKFESMPVFIRAEGKNYK